MKTKPFRFQLGTAIPILCAAILLSAHAALAATFTVTNTGDAGTGSLRSAIERANSIAGTDTIVFALPVGAARVISLRSPLPALSTSMTINNTGQPVTVERNAFLMRGEEDFNIFNVTRGSVVTLEGLTITKGTAGGVNNGGTLTMRNCTVEQNDGASGVSNSATGTAIAQLILEDCVFSGNRVVREYVAPFATAGGGALYNRADPGAGAIVTITNCTFRQNSSVRAQIMGCPGGAIANYSSGGKASIFMSNSLVENNSSDNLGAGGIYNATSAQSGTAELTLLDCIVRDNPTGGIRNYAYYDTNLANTVVTLENSTLSGNQYPSGGAVSNRGTLSLTNCTLSQNSAGGSSPDTGGGAILNSAGTASVTNCTFSGKVLTGEGRGQSVFNKSGATFRTGNSLFAATSPGVSFVNEGTFMSRGHNLCNDNAGGPLSTGPGGWLNAAGDRRITHPKILSLANNGGPTPTCALQSDSPAINAGADTMAPPTDQRGYPRSGISDIGAYERQ